MHKEDVSNTAFLFIAGATVGAGIALLFDPRAGSEIRLFVRQYARKATDEMDHMSGEGGSALGSMLQRGKEWIEGAMSKQGASGGRPTQEGSMGSEPHSRHTAGDTGHEN